LAPKRRPSCFRAIQLTLNPELIERLIYSSARFGFSPEIAGAIGACVRRNFSSWRLAGLFGQEAVLSIDD
jgi:hypothetical protein